MSQIKSILSMVWGVTTFIAVIAILLAIVSTILGAFVLLIGRFLAPWFEVRTFEAAVIVLGVAALVAYLFSSARQVTHVLEPIEDEEWDEEDWEEEEEEDVIIPPRSRNDPCPCGSGKKYKYCHGRNA